MVAWLGADLNLRQCTCFRDWQDKAAKGEASCKCDVMCPPEVTPLFLTEAAGQALCSLEEPQGYNCYASCNDGKANWFAKGCGTEPSQEECDKPILAGRRAGGEADARAAVEAAAAEVAAAAAAAEEAAAAENAAAAAAAAAAPAAPPAPAAGEGGGTPGVVDAGGASIGGVALPFDPKLYYDLRGLKCELLNGAETCFLEDEQGRELCPPSVTAEYLTNPPDQYTCSPEMSKEYYCTVGCQEGNPEVRWGANEVKWCAQPGNAAGCGVRQPPVLRSAYKLAAWSEVVPPKTPCQEAWARGERPASPIPLLSVGLLTHEPRSFRDSMATYEKFGLFDVLGEFTIYINKRTPEVEAVAEEYAARHKCIRVMGTAENVGILRAMNYIVGNASQPYILFLERDFQLVEPATCVVEQLAAGVKMLQEGTAHVMRYRHKKQAGRPNWAAKMFKGQEDEVFRRGQPNLFCNHHYWYEKPEERWPDKIWICNKVGWGEGGAPFFPRKRCRARPALTAHCPPTPATTHPPPQEPTMWCSDSFYCNWTNNPQMWSVAWWQKEYVANFANFRSSDPYHDIESYMNWEPNSWNTRKWTVAQGQGLWKHVDRNNFGS